MANSAGILGERGVSYYNQKKYDEAVEAFDRALESDPNNEFAWTLKLSSLRIGKRSAEADKLIDEALERFPNSAGILGERGISYFNQKMYDQAVEVFDKALGIDPNNEFAWQWKLTSLRVGKRSAEADKLIDEVLEKVPRGAGILAERGISSYNQKKYEQAVEAFDKALEIDPDNEFAWQWKLTSLRIGKRSAEADKLIDEALAKFPNSAGILGERGVSYYNQKKYDEAVKVFDKAIEVDPNNEFGARWKIFSLRAIARFSRSADYRAIEKELEAALTRFPDSVGLSIEQGWLWSDRREYEKAAKVFDNLVARFPNDEEAFVAKIDFLRNCRRTEEAASVIKKAQKALPESAQIRRELGALRFDQGRYEKAIEVFDQALALDENDTFSRLWRISSLRLLGEDGAPDKFTQVENDLKQALAQTPGSTELLIERARLCSAQQQREDADEYFEQALDVDPSDMGVRLAYATFLTSTNRADKALEVQIKLKEEFDGQADVIEQLGWFYLGRNDYTNAEKEFVSVLDSAPLIANNGLGGVDFNRRKYPEAEAYFRKVVKVAPNHPVFKTNLAWALVRRDQKSGFSEARELCQNALALNSTYSAALGCLGVMCFKEGRLGQAEEYLRESARVNRRQGNYTELGALYVQMGKYDDAREALKSALTNNPNDVQAHIELGNLNLQTDRNSDAITAFRLSVAIGPGNEDCHRALAIALMKVERLDEAENVVRTAIRKLDKDQVWLLHLTLAQLLTKRGDNSQEKQYYEEALSEVKKAIEVRSDRAEVFLHSGIIRFKLGDFVRAWLDFRKCLNLDPGNYEAERNVKLVASRFLKESPLVKTTLLGGLGLAAICVVQLWWLWQHFLAKDNTVSEKMLLVLVPLLLGLFVVSFLLPVLVRLKLPGGFEAELTQPKSSETVSTGPKGDVGFSSAAPTASSGPR